MVEMSEKQRVKAIINVVPENLKGMVRKVSTAYKSHSCSRFELMGNMYEEMDKPLKAGTCFMGAADMAERLGNKAKAADLSLKASHSMRRYGTMLEIEAEVAAFGKDDGKSKINLYLKAFSSNVTAALLLNNMVNPAFNHNEAKLLLRAERDLEAARSLVIFTTEKRFYINTRMRNTLGVFNVLKSRADIQQEFMALRAEED